MVEFLTKRIRKEKLVERYRKCLSISPDFPITEAMVWKHWELERTLAQMILLSSTKDRPRISRCAYQKFYQELPWLKDPKCISMEIPIEMKESAVIQLIDPKPQRILEIGSGTGELIRFLSQKGHWCIGTDLIQDRFRKSVPNLKLIETDGVRFPIEKLTSPVDVVLSLNVIEHFHPEDLDLHFQMMHRILRSGGKYILKTPHGFFGPHGIEKVFGIRSSHGLHLHEYTFREIQKTGKRNGFKSISAVFMWPKPLVKILGKRSQHIKASQFYFRYLCGLEKIVGLIQNWVCRKLFLIALRFAFFPRQVFVILYKLD